MSADGAMTERVHGPTGLPQLRTLLLTDLCDSTTLVERLGDGAAAGLFQAHDRLVLQLQQRWRGRLIDRSDGLLLLFERPIDGLGFALDYTRGLLELGRPYEVQLQARAGLHVGEVLTWRNSDEAVQVGAKPLEVEGLAKPMAGRLMSLARPGQILLSAVAEPLAARSARELGERGEQLLWKSHGRWCFKGVPGSQEIFEVGEPGPAPLRMPASTAKAWRDIPLWRRPAALAAELALIAALGGGLWFATRPQPAIAFGERDWVVVGDLRNLTGDKLLDDSLEQAFRISLEQSRYVNVLSDLKARETLQRMRRSADATLDRTLASEVAVREGARAVLLPTVAEVGGRVQVAVEVIDPRTQATVFAESANGAGIGTVLGSIDRVSGRLREALGEELKSINANSKPLPEVTTSSLEALRAYALAQQAYQLGNFNDAGQLYTRATMLDPGFALAWAGRMRVLYSLEKYASAHEALQTAFAHRDRLPLREQLYLDGWAAEFDAPADITARWQELARLFPDYYPGQGNAALALYRDNRFDAAVSVAKAAAVRQNDLVTRAYDTLGRASLAQERYAQAAAAFDTALQLGYRSSLRWRMSVEAAQRNFAAADRLAAGFDRDDPFPAIERTSIRVSQGQFDSALAAIHGARMLAAARDPFVDRAFSVIEATVAGLGGDDRKAERMSRLAGAAALDAYRQPASANALNDMGVAISAALVAVRLGKDERLARRVLASLAQDRKLQAVPVIAEYASVLRARLLLRKGAADRAVRELEPWLRGNARFQTRVALADALLAAGRTAEAASQFSWVRAHPGFAYAELNFGQSLQTLNVADVSLAGRGIRRLCGEGHASCSRSE